MNFPSSFFLLASLPYAICLCICGLSVFYSSLFGQNARSFIASTFWLLPWILILVVCFGDDFSSVSINDQIEMGIAPRTPSPWFDSVKAGEELPMTCLRGLSVPTPISTASMPISLMSSIWGSSKVPSALTLILCVSVFLPSKLQASWILSNVDTYWTVLFLPGLFGSKVAKLPDSAPRSFLELSFDGPVVFPRDCWSLKEPNCYVFYSLCSIIFRLANGNK